MPVGGYYFDRTELDSFARKLEQYAGSIKDLTKLYREIGKYAAEYVKVHEPLPSYDHSKNSSTHLPDGYMQSKTKGGGGKYGAWVTISDVPYLMLQEFGGGSRWYRGESHFYYKKIIGVTKRGHLKTRNARANYGHIIYTKARERDGYFIWNVAYRLRDWIGATMTSQLKVMAEEHGLLSEVEDKQLIIPKNPGPTGGRSRGGGSGFTRASTRYVPGMPTSSWYR